MPVKIREAVKNATDYFTDVMDGKVSGLMLEEVDNSGDGKDWLVTLSAWVPESKPPISPRVGVPGAAGLEELFRSEHVKIFRIFDVDAETGDVKFMKIRKAE